MCKFVPFAPSNLTPPPLDVTGEPPFQHQATTPSVPEPLSLIPLAPEI